MNSYYTEIIISILQMKYLNFKEIEELGHNLLILNGSSQY